MMAEKTYIFKMTCPDTVGIVAAVTQFIAENGGFITSSSHYGDPTSGRFFMRTVFHATNSKVKAIEEYKALFAPIAEEYSMQWELNDSSYRPRVLIAVSKFGHCLNLLLHKAKTGQIAIDIPAIISNHLDMRDIAEWYGIPFIHLPVTSEVKEAQEERFIKTVEELNIDLVVLARYMQILSPKMVDALKWKCINIHHSFLPSFKGAAPYQQAYNRGVKLIGATAHYVTSDLDEGPIIEQAVERIDHSFLPNDIATTAHDLEAIVLARAVKWHAEHRILLNGNKTVIFK